MRDSIGRKKAREKLERSLGGVTGLGERIALGGEEWHIFPLNLRDYTLLRSWLQANPSPDKQEGEKEEEYDERSEDWFRTMLFQTLWLSLRKNCLTPQELQECYATDEWPLTPEDISLIVPLQDIEEVAEKVFTFLRIKVGGRNGSGAGTSSDPEGADGGQDAAQAGQGGLAGAVVSEPGEAGNPDGGAIGDEPASDSPPD